jgi:glycogen(starch) synthase
MNILLTAHRFFPDIGGTETQAELMAEEFSKAGHKTVVVTHTVGEPMTRHGYELVRRPSIRKLLQLYRWSDVILQRTVALRTAWPLLFVRRPWVVIHNDWLDRDRGIRTWLKQQVIRFAKNVAISQAVADRLPVQATVILNAYRNEVFKLPLRESRHNDLIFVGRLIRGKGVQILIEAMRELARRGFHRELTIVGTGRDHSEFVCAAEGLPVKFLGVKHGRELSDLIADHKTMVVPSLEPEPFGIVALEGLASGCAVVASRGGGLPEAVGPHGVLFESGNKFALADAILAADARSDLLKGVAEHLAQHDAAYVAAKYLKVLESAIAERRKLDRKQRRSMNILITAHRFFPEIGGTETVTELLAEEFCKAGHKAVVVTQTLGESVASTGYEVVRRPSTRRLLQLYLGSDIILQHQIALRTAWPLLLIRRPWVVIHNDWIDRDKGFRSWLKRRAIRFAKNVTTSHALAERLSVDATVIPNPYQDKVFKSPQGGARLYDLIFVGRLIRGKGVHILIEALRELARRGFRRALTIVGTGPDLPEFVRAAEGLPITFVGVKRGSELAELIADHKTLVVPSLEPEPFGIVALEGLASGCAVVASRGGGLVEALGPHGVLFQSGNPSSLADAILAADNKPELLDRVSQHLAQHSGEYIAAKYLQILESTIAEHRKFPVSVTVGEEKCGFRVSDPDASPRNQRPEVPKKQSLGF